MEWKMEYYGIEWANVYMYGIISIPDCWHRQTKSVPL